VQPDDDEAWRGIVDNYGERVELDPDPPSATPFEAPATRPASSYGEERTWEDPDSDWSTDRFVPPPPPPVPTPPRDRFVAWIGLLGAPGLLLLCLVTGISIPSWLPLLLVAAFVAGFVYLVVRMPREPRDPGDDGAVL
jgi:hypothetical protein